MSLLTDLDDRGQTGLSIAGEWRTSSDGRTFDVLDPATAQHDMAVSVVLETKYIAADW